ncbi:MAG TPA: hypothetical protein VK992_04610, partial [Candidatus Caenarcaniphilales bacterium]|nr:hypothetical protein [Candidatus Caenarcaniphilales bacterium]
HALTLLLAPGIGLYVLLVQPRLLWQRPRLVAACTAVLVLTTAILYAYLPLRSAMDPPLDYANPETLDGFRYLVLAEQFRGTFQDYPPLLDAVALVGQRTLDELGVVAWLAVLGVVVSLLRRPPLFVLLAAWYAVTSAFALGYLNAEIERYYLVPMLAAAVFAGLGAGAIWTAALAALSARTPRPADTRRAAAIATAVAAVLLVGPSLASVPTHFDDVDQSGERTGREWVEAVLPRLEPNAVVMSWWSYSTPLWYAQFVEGRRPDVDVIDDRTVLDRGLGNAVAVVERHLDERPVYVVRLGRDLAEMAERYVLTPLDAVGAQSIFRVEGRR